MANVGAIPEPAIGQGLGARFLITLLLLYFHSPIIFTAISIHSFLAVIRCNLDVLFHNSLML